MSQNNNIMTNKETIQNLAYTIAELESVNRDMEKDLNTQAEELVKYDILQQEHDELINDYKNLNEEHEALKAVCSKQAEEIKTLNEKLQKIKENINK